MAAALSAPGTITLRSKKRRPRSGSRTTRASSPAAFTRAANKVEIASGTHTAFQRVGGFFVLFQLLQLFIAEARVLIVSVLDVGATKLENLHHLVVAGCRSRDDFSHLLLDVVVDFHVGLKEVKSLGGLKRITRKKTEEAVISHHSPRSDTVLRRHHRLFTKGGHAVDCRHVKPILLALKTKPIHVEGPYVPENIFRRLDPISHSLNRDVASKRKTHVVGGRVGPHFLPLVFDDRAGLDTRKRKGLRAQLQSTDLYHGLFDDIVFKQFHD